MSCTVQKIQKRNCYNLLLWHQASTDRSSSNHNMFDWNDASEIILYKEELKCDLLEVAVPLSGVPALYSVTKEGSYIFIPSIWELSSLFPALPFGFLGGNNCWGCFQEFELQVPDMHLPWVQQSRMAFNSVPVCLILQSSAVITVGF